MPIAMLHILEGRDEATKARLIADVSKAISTALDAPLPSIRVLVSEVPATQWGVAGETMRDKRVREQSAASHSS